MDALADPELNLFVRMTRLYVYISIWSVDRNAMTDSLSYNYNYSDMPSHTNCHSCGVTETMQV